MKKVIILLCSLMIAVNITAQNDYHALYFHSPLSFFNYEMMKVHNEYQQRRQDFQHALQSKQSMEIYIQKKRQRFQLLTGNLPQRCRIVSKTTGTVEGTEFHIEKIIFLSAPHRYVTAHLYLPDNIKGRIPACIEMCGHGLNGKGNGSVLAERMAVNGIAVMVVDPIGQGERQQLIDKKGHNLTRGVTTAHTLLAPAYMLTGSSLAVQEYFDNSRAIDYLLTRKDIDGNKIGCYGFSGGGTQSAYLISLDPRIKVGCVGLFFSSRERTLENQGPSDGCQWIAGEGKEGIEIADMAMMMAPRPLLILDGIFDFVDHWGALQGYNELKQCYTVLGNPERVDQYYSQDGHATPVDIQIKMVKWFRKWLLNEEGNLKPLIPWQGKNMLCTHKGQVNLEFKDADNTMISCEKEMEQWAGARDSFCRQNETVIKDKMKQILGIPKYFNDSVEIVRTGHRMLRDEKEYRYQLNVIGEYPVPIVVRIPANTTSKSLIVVHLTDIGKGAWLNEVDRTDAISNGSIIIAADLRGFDESADPYQYNLLKYWNAQYRTAVIALHAGESLIGQRVIDIHTLLDFCQQQPGLKGHQVVIDANGINAVAVMHATILDSRIQSAHVSQTLKSWRSYIVNPLQHDMMSNVLVGVLHYYDIPDLVKMSKGRIIFDD